MEKSLKQKIQTEQDKNKPKELRSFLVRFTPEEYSSLQAQAEKLGLSMSATVRLATREMIDTLAKKKTG